MPLEHNADAHILLETAHTDDTFVRKSINKTFAVRLLSARCQEAQTQNLANQDYAQVIMQADGSSLCFCVCDGVGSSYKGDFAAQFLAKNLVQWMYSLNTLYRDASIVSQLTAQLNHWALQAQEQLQQLALPADTPGLVREVLEELRDTYGSETVFLCGRIDNVARSGLSGALDAGVAHTVQLLVFWMGNVTAQLLASTNPGAIDQHVTLGGDDDTVARWSTLQGARGPIAMRNMRLSCIKRLIVHTDGLDAISLSLHTMDDAAWQAQVQQLLLLSRNDDMTALDVQWLYRESNDDELRSEDGI